MNTWSLPSSTHGEHRCDNCGIAWTDDELERIEDIENRIDPGSVVPSGECPACGSLCYPEADFSELLHVCKEIMKYVDRNGQPVNEDDIRVILPSDLLREVRRLIDGDPL